MAIFVLYACSGPVTTIRSVKRLRLEHVVGDDHGVVGPVLAGCVENNFMLFSC